MTKAMGADNSHWNGIIIWELVPRELKFIYLKSTETTTWKDIKYRRNAYGCRQNEFPYAPYHFWRYATDSYKQAEWFHKFVSENSDYCSNPKLRPCVDLEDLSAPKCTSSMIPKIRDVLVATEELFAITPIAYTAKWWWDPWTNKCSLFSAYKLWNAAYTHDPYGASSDLPAGWTEALIHQWTDKGMSWLVPGMKAGSNLDLNYTENLEGVLYG